MRTPSGMADTTPCWSPAVPGNLEIRNTPDSGYSYIVVVETPRGFWPLYSSSPGELERIHTGSSTAPPTPELNERFEWIYVAPAPQSSDLAWQDWVAVIRPRGSLYTQLLEPHSLKVYRFRGNPGIEPLVRAGSKTTKERTLGSGDNLLLLGNCPFCFY
jgi:hypothetical protein